MALTKKQRQQVFAKSNGVCWYCGCNLPEKGWHADHFVCLHRNYYGKGKHRNADLDVVSNHVPSCAPCNLFKRTWSIEEFRGEITLQVERARKSSVNFRMSERFGLIEITSKPVTFWFETQQK